jgi:class 3 adenylate cyclase
MPFPKIIPALADLTQDIAGPLPVELLQNWASGTQDLTTAEELLERFRLGGHVVSTDTSGLSRMTQERDLLEVLSAISAPKEIVHALGTEIGGRPIGTWVADNSEMYYPLSLAPEDVLDAMNEAQFRIAEVTPVQIGLCVHSGVFYEIGGGLYGQDALLVEYLAERFAGPGEILVTRQLVDALAQPEWYSFVPRSDLESIHPAGVLRLTGARRMPQLDGKNVGYPHPFSPDFFELFLRLKGSPPHEEVKARIYEQYLRECAILFLAREQRREAENSLSFLLDELVMNALLDTLVRKAMRARDHIAASGGGIAILSFETVPQALEFAEEIRMRFSGNGLPVSLGIDWGPVLLLRNPSGPSGIAGDPVNVTSKISEDLGEPGKIHVTSRAARHLQGVLSDNHFSVTISDLLLTGIVL